MNGAEPPRNRSRGRGGKAREGSKMRALFTKGLLAASVSAALFLGGIPEIGSWDDGMSAVGQAYAAGGRGRGAGSGGGGQDGGSHDGGSHSDSSHDDSHTDHDHDDSDHDHETTGGTTHPRAARAKARNIEAGVSAAEAKEVPTAQWSRRSSSASERSSGQGLPARRGRWIWNIEPPSGGDDRSTSQSFAWQS